MVGATDSFRLRAKSRLRRLRSDTRLRAQPQGEANTAKSRRFPGKEAAALLWRTRAQHIYYTTFAMCYSILIMHKYCI